uniref:Uncharacterized protein n=1 Tax=Arundo donax TaxID=35708 RepID=A0A0A9ETD4_ARUDO
MSSSGEVKKGRFTPRPSSRPSTGLPPSSLDGTCHRRGRPRRSPGIASAWRRSPSC